MFFDLSEKIYLTAFPYTNANHMKGLRLFENNLQPSDDQPVTSEINSPITL